MRKTGFQISVLLLISAAVYINTLPNGFVYDDNFQILGNPWIRDPANIPLIFKSNVWAFDGSVTNYYRPAMHLIYMLGYRLFGLAPWGFHLLSILLNSAACLLVFVVTARLIRDFGMDHAASSYVPLLTAVIFAVHPVHTEAVAWAGAVTDLSYVFFYLLSFYFYIISRDGGAAAGWGAFISAASFFAAMLCKEPAVTLPAVLFGYDYAVKRSRDGLAAYLKRYAPYALAFAIYLAVRAAALGGFAPNPPSLRLGAYQVFLNIPLLFYQYLEKLLFPTNLNALHPFRPISSVFEPSALLGITAAAVFLAALVFLLKKRSVWSLALLLVAAPLLPSLYIPGIVSRTVFGERYLYLPVFGLALIVSLSYDLVRERMPAAGKPLAILLVALIAACSAGTVMRNRAWADDIALFSDSVEKSPGNPTARVYLGEAYDKRGLVDKAIDEYNAAIGLDKGDTLAHVDLARAYIEKGRLEEAVKECGYALSRGVDDTRTRARAFSYLGAVYSKTGQLDRATEDLRRSAALNPALAGVHDELGKVYVRKGMLDEALTELDKAIALDPMRPEAYNDRGVIYMRMGRTDMAVEQFESGLRLNPRDALLRENLRRASESR